jgi:hypothetical protein
MVAKRGLPLVPWDVCTMPKDEGGLDLIDVTTQGSILAAKWVVRCLEGSDSLADFILAQGDDCSTFWSGSEGLLGYVILFLLPTCFRSLVPLFSGVFGRLGGMLQVWSIGIGRVVE